MESKTETKLKCGSVVEEKIKRMTVREVSPQCIICNWFDADNHLHTGIFDAKDLILISQ